MSVPLQDRVYARLAGCAALVALVGTRISFGKALQESATPYVEYSLIGTALDYTQDGPVDIHDTFIQIDSWADDADQARAVNEQVINALLRDSPQISLYFFVHNDGTDDDKSGVSMRRHRVISEVQAFYAEA